MLERERERDSMSQEIFFTSDFHFGHANIIKFCNRPYSSVDEMNERLIENYNSVVKKGSIVYILGDAFWRSLSQEEAFTIATRLNGQKYYINGNHEERMQHKDMHKLFIWRKDYAKIHPAGYPRIVLLHYAMRVWEGSHYNDWHLFGHSHNALTPASQGATTEESALSMDVGVDTHDMKPWSIEEIAEKMREKGWEA